MESNKPELQFVLIGWSYCWMGERAEGAAVGVVDDGEVCFIDGIECLDW